MNNVSGMEIDDEVGTSNDSVDHTCDPRDLRAIHLRRRRQLVRRINRQFGPNAGD